MSILICGAVITNVPLSVEISYMCFTCQADRSPDWELLLGFFLQERGPDQDEPSSLELVDVLGLARRFQKKFPGQLSNCFYVKLLELTTDPVYAEDDDPLLMLIDPSRLTQHYKVPDHMLN